MDSGNSSSMQSSSGGDDQEYDSRSFFPNITPPPPPPLAPPVNNPQLLFNPPDHHPGYLQAFSDRDLFTWPPPPLLRSNPTHPNPNQNMNYLSFSGEFSAPAAATTVAAAPQQQQPPPPPPQAPEPKAQNPGPSKNPKKRTRASRRAPTTVLTTDTTNFRAMVQEFTGIPDPPFSAAASVYSRRLDLLGTAGSSMRLAVALGSGGGLLRPTAQRLPASNNVIQEVISQSGSGQPDPMLAFQTLLQQPHHQQLGYQQQPQPLSSNHNATFGINIGLLGSENHLSDTIGLESSPGNLLRMNSHHHQQLGGSTGNNDNNNSNNNNYVMSCGAMTSSSSTDLIQLQGEYRNQ